MAATTTPFHGVGRDYVEHDGTATSLRGFPMLMAVVVGAWMLAMIPVFHEAVLIWMGDPLRSLGMFFPVLAVVLIARVWRGLGWERNGTWWGLVPLLVAVAMVLARESYRITFLPKPEISVDLLPNGPILFLSLSAAVLMTGGARVWRKSLFPLMLVLFVNPFPSAFNALLDVPLQHASAATARRFALLIGEHPDGEQLRMMFTPDFGMFIAPGCNGIRGAVTLGYIGLIASYWRGFSVPMRLLSAFGGMAMGYLFNFLRLCLVVVYYKVGRTVTWIQPHGALIDYLIGGMLFLFLSVCFGLFLFRPDAEDPEPTEMESPYWLEPSPVVAVNRVWVAGAFVLVCLTLGVSNVYAIVRDGRAAKVMGPKVETAVVLPQTVGRYRLVSQWMEGTDYLWGRYTDGHAGNDVSMGLWTSGGYHDATLCHLYRGERVTFGQVLAHRDASGAQTTFRTFQYDDGVTNSFAASKICAGCTEVSDPVRWVGPVQLIRKPADSYFKNPSVVGVLITHEADRGLGASPAGYEPLRAVIDALDGDALISRVKH